MPDIDHDSTGRQPVVCYVPAALHRRIKEQAARELTSASTWLRRVILDRLQAETERRQTAR